MTMARIHSWLSISLEVFLVLLSVMVVYFLSGMILNEEPRYSKVNDGPIYSKSDIELKTLEKLVRLEHKFEILEKKLDKMVELNMAEAKGTAQIEEIKKELMRQKNHIDEMVELNMAEAKGTAQMEEIKKELMRQKNHIDEMVELNMAEAKGTVQIEEIKKMLMRQKNHIESVKESFEHLEQEQGLANDRIAALAEIPSVNFRTTGKASVLYDTGKIIVKNTDGSTGRGYDDSTGYFTAPVTGLYIFYAELDNTSRKLNTIKMSLMNNEESLKSDKGDAGQDEFRNCLLTNSIHCKILTSIVLINKQDKIWLRCDVSSGYHDVHAAFSGMFVF